MKSAYVSPLGMTTMQMERELIKHHQNHPAWHKMPFADVVHLVAKTESDPLKKVAVEYLSRSALPDARSLCRLNPPIDYSEEEARDFRGVMLDLFCVASAANLFAGDDSEIAPSVTDALMFLNGFRSLESSYEGITKVLAWGKDKSSEMPTDTSGKARIAYLELWFADYLKEQDAV